MCINMVSIIIGVDEQTRKLMKQFPEMNWSGFVRKVIKEKTQELSLKEKLLAKIKGESFEEDILLGAQVNTAISKRLKKEKLL